MTCEAVITVDAANIRIQTQTNAAIVGILRRGARVPVHDRTDNTDASGFYWFNVTVPANGQRGWVRADLIQLSGDCSQFASISTSPPIDTEPGRSPSSEPQLAPSPQPMSDPIVLIGDCMAEVTVAMATIRSGPGLGNSIRGFVNRGQKFAITDISETDNENFRWYAFDYKGADGWIREDLANETGDCLDLRTHNEPSEEQGSEEEPPEQESPPPTPQACTALAGLPRATVRAQPTTNSASLGSAMKNQRFEVRNITAPQADGFTWTEITFNGQAGFMRSDLVTLLGDCARFTNDERLPRPVSGQITQGFRPSHNPTHNGVDFGTSGQQEMRVAIPATVARAHECSKCAGTPSNIFTTDPNRIREIFSDSDWGFGYGNHIILRYEFEDLPRSVQEQMRRMGLNESHAAFVLYAHLSQMLVSQGQKIEAGFLFGITGNTGFSSAEHLHLEVAFGSQWGNATKVHPATLFSVIRA